MFILMGMLMAVRGVLFFDLAAFEVEDEGGAAEAVGIAELIDEVLFVGLAHEIGMIDKEDETRRMDRYLREVIDAQASSLDHGRMVLLQDLFHELIELSGGDPAVELFMDGLDKLNVYQRPIHCTDRKRETIYIKDNDVWEKDTENKDKIRRFVGKVAKKNLNMVSPWQHSYPGIDVLDSPAYNLYMKIMRESINCGGRQEHADRNDARIIKNLINRVYVDKHIDTKPSLL